MIQDFVFIRQAPFPENDFSHYWRYVDGLID
jgi:hypothetical protein